MSYRLTSAIAEDARFRARVRACLLDVATDVANESPAAAGPDTTEGEQTIDASFTRAARQRLAFDTLAQPATAETPFAWVVAANPQVQSGASIDDDGFVVLDDTAGKADDNALKFLCTSSWDRVARWRASGRTA